MVIKIVVLFLVAMGVLAMFGRFTFPGQQKLANMRCARCGKFRIGKGPCGCKKGS